MATVPRFPETSKATLLARRAQLAARVKRPVLLLSGSAPPRNYPANRYPFRASSHFLYLVGAPIQHAALLLHEGRAVLFAEQASQSDALWHGPSPSLEDRRLAHALDDARPLEDLDAALAPIRRDLATLPPQDTATAAWLGELVGRRVAPGSGDRLEHEPDVELADAMIALRLRHDAAAQAQLRAAARASSAAHVEAMRATRTAGSEADVLAAFLAELARKGMSTAYGPIVTVRGEVLHEERHENLVVEGDLLLCDVGGETPEGWASDITRTWPVSGRFSPTQRAIYDLVLEAQRQCIERVRPGVSYRTIHETAKRAIVEGLVALGVLRGSVDGLLERGAAALFFPHGIGHLLGLDVHDLEDLGDRAGYAPGRARSARFGDGYLRLDRDLEPGMAVTIEPGFYQVPGILGDEALTAPLGTDLDHAALERFRDVRGIRIEDDVLCTEGEPEVLTADCPKRPGELEAILRSA
jgi:Xaa-Pro aminopeptidase